MSSIVQTMPGRSVRLDPAILAELIPFLMAKAQPFVTEAHKTTRGKQGLDRETAQARIAAYQAWEAAFQFQLDHIGDTVPLAEYESARQEYVKALQAPTPGDALALYSPESSVANPSEQSTYGNQHSDKKAGSE